MTAECQAIDTMSYSKFDLQKVQTVFDITIHETVHFLSEWSSVAPDLLLEETLRDIDLEFYPLSPIDRLLGILLHLTCHA